MTLRGLRIFVTVVKTGKMSAAANELYIAQPTISQTINELEREYGVELFDRLNKKLFLTREGEVFYEYANKILALSQEMDENIKNMTMNKTIHLGATITVGKCVLVDIIKRFEKSFPNIKVVVKIDNTTVIERLLLESKVDIGLVEGKVKSSELISKPVISDELVLACSSQHEISQRVSVEPEELSAYPFILREEGSGTRDLFEGILHKRNISINTKWNCHGFDSIIEATLANQGITVISERIVADYVRDGRLCVVPINGVDMRRKFCLVYHKTKYIGDALRKLMDFISLYEINQTEE